MGETERQRQGWVGMEILRETERGRRASCREGQNLLFKVLLTQAQHPVLLNQSLCITPFFPSQMRMRARTHTENRCAAVETPEGVL